MPLLPLTSPRPDVKPGETAPPEVPHTEISLACEWPGVFTDVDKVGLTLMNGWGLARLRLVHAQVYDNGSATPTDHVDLLGGQGPYDMGQLERRHFGPLPKNCGGVTVQYECPNGSLHALFEYKAQEA